MDDLAWSDLDTDEQRAIAMLAQGISPDFCDAVALLTLRRIGLIKGSRLTFAAEEMLSSAVRSHTVTSNSMAAASAAASAICLVPPVSEWNTISRVFMRNASLDRGQAGRRCNRDPHCTVRLRQ